MSAVDARERWSAGTHLTAGIAGTGVHRYLPLEVPDGVGQLQLRWTTSLPAAIGVGLFDPRGPGYQSPGFRGVCGTERDEVVVARGDATPGFLAGPVPGGRWTVLVSVFAALPGTRLDVEVTWGPDDRSPPPRVEVPGVVRDEPGWYRADLHCHTVHSSDAWSSGRAMDPPAWAALARERALDVVAMTDHNVVSQNRDLSSGGTDLLLLAGEEMTNWFHGHAIVAGLPDTDAWLDFRQRPSWLPTGQHERRIAAFWEQVQELGAFAAPAHPYGVLKSWQFMLADTLRRPLPLGLEVWNGRFSANDRITLRYWDALLRAGLRVTAVGGSDLHERPPEDAGPDALGPGTPTTVVGAGALSREAVVAALLAGRTALSSGPAGPRLHVEAVDAEGNVAHVGDVLHGRDGDAVRVLIRADAPVGAELDLVSERGRELVGRVEHPDQRFDVTRTVDGTGYARFELRRGRTRVVEALTNPVHLRRGAPRPVDDQPLAPELA